MALSQPDADDFNPYASPAESSLVAPELADAVWRHDKTLVMHRAALLPGRCVKCNGPAEVWLKRKLAWCHPAWYLMLFFNLLVCLLVVAVVSKKAKISVPICRADLRRRRLRILWAWLVAIGSFVALLCGLLLGMDRNADWRILPVLVGLAGAGFIVAAVVGYTAQLFTVARIDKQFIRLRHVCPDYLDMLPETAM